MQVRSKFGPVLEKTQDSRRVNVHHVHDNDDDRDDDRGDDDQPVITT